MHSTFFLFLEFPLYFFASLLGFNIEGLFMGGTTEQGRDGADL